jgi:hypothetical protein
MQSPESPQLHPDPQQFEYTVSTGEVLLLTIQSLLLAASLAVNALVFLRHYLGLAPAAAATLGLLAGLVAGYPSMRILARGDGVQLPWYKWLAVAIAASGIAYAALSVF